MKTVEPVPIDPMTGMPAVPNGYFWRVRPVGSEPKWAYYVYVELRKKQIIGSTQLARAMADQADVYGPTLADAVKVTAERVYRENFARRTVPTPEYVGILGDYPPKSL